MGRNCGGWTVEEMMHEVVYTPPLKKMDSTLIIIDEADKLIIVYFPFL
ncbi:MAG: hypothetical protein ACRC9X_01840 [Bacteroidales bacterium]